MLLHLVAKEKGISSRRMLKLFQYQVRPFVRYVKISNRYYVDRVAFNQWWDLLFEPDESLARHEAALDEVEPERQVARGSSGQSEQDCYAP